MTTALTRITSRPGAEGANIRNWIGFKHFLYLVEDAITDWHRRRGYGPRRLFTEYGMGLAIVDASVLLPRVLDVDDEVEAEVAPTAEPGRFGVRLRSGDTVALRGKVTAVLVARPDAPVAPSAPDGFVVSTDQTLAGVPETGTFRWDWRVPYFYCQFSARLSFAGHVRAMEDVVDRFLADRGISVRRMLDERGWIPVVSRVRLSVLGEVAMEETVRTTFTVESVVKETMFDGRMDSFVRRDGRWIHVATGRILHGYAASRGPRAGSLATLDAATIAALTGPAR